MPALRRRIPKCPPITKMHIDSFRRNRLHENRRKNSSEVYDLSAGKVLRVLIPTVTQSGRAESSGTIAASNFHGPQVGRKAGTGDGQHRWYWVCNCRSTGKGRGIGRGERANRAESTGGLEATATLRNSR